MLKHLVVAAAVALSVASVACHVGEVTDITETYEAETSQATIVCKSPFVKPDLSTLKACGSDAIGHGHCYDKTKGEFDPTQLTAPGCAANELCVPDKVLESNGTPLKSCKSIGGSPGACTSLLQQELNANKGFVPQDVCDADERCGPCIDPRTNKDSGACLPQGAHQDACTGGAGDKIELCCHGVGTCVGKSAVPADDVSSLGQDTCSKDTLLCAPSSLVNGEAPKKCDVLGLSGVCLDVCFNSMLGGLKAVRGSCNPEEVCIPCAVGKGQGLPGCE